MTRNSPLLLIKVPTASKHDAQCLTALQHFWVKRDIYLHISSELINEDSELISTTVGICLLQGTESLSWGLFKNL